MIRDGWLSSVRKLSSPNFNQRPCEDGISLLVIHNISLPPEQFGGGYITEFFLNKLDTNIHPYFETIKTLQVSAHCLITRNGEVTQFVSFVDRAWHAGRSNYCGVLECNDFSIGIELEGTDTIPYTEEQYMSLADLAKQIMLEYPKITLDRIVGHSDIAPGRKTDPGSSFDWNRFKSQIGQL